MIYNNNSFPKRINFWNLPTIILYWCYKADPLHNLFELNILLYIFLI